jgi:hypothetical protein
MGICSRTLLVVAVLAALGRLLTVANMHNDWAIEGGPQNVKFTRGGNGVALSLTKSSGTCMHQTGQSARVVHNYVSPQGAGSGQRSHSCTGAFRVSSS